MKHSYGCDNIYKTLQSKSHNQNASMPYKVKNKLYVFFYLAWHDIQIFYTVLNSQSPWILVCNQSSSWALTVGRSDISLQENNGEVTEVIAQK